MSRFETLFTIDVAHRFFGADPCTVLDFVPSAASRARAAKAGLLVRSTPTGTHVCRDLERRDALALYAADRDDPLAITYRVRSRDPQLASYTDPTPLREGQVLLFDNRATRPEPGGTALLLHGGDFVGEADFAGWDAEELRGLATSRDRLAPPAAVVRVFVSDEAGGLLDPADPAPVAYHLSFQARSTYWKYYLLGPLAGKRSFITDPDDEIEFESSGETALPGDRTAVTFTSTTRIPLRRRSERRFQLREHVAGNGNGNGAGRVLVKRLPVASPEGSFRETIDGRDAIVSDMYING